MLTWTNMTRPGDPYRTGELLYRRPPPLLAAFAAGGALRSGGRLLPASCVMVYLPLHRTRPVTVAGQTVAFGCRATGITMVNETAALAAVADLDLMQARRHAAILAAHAPRASLAALRSAAAGPARGLSAAGRAWAGRHEPVRGMAMMIDTARDLPGGPGLAGICEQGHVAFPADPAGPGACPARSGEGEPATAVTIARAVAVALACAWYLGRYEWDGTLDTKSILTAHAWDCLPRPGQEDNNGQRRPRLSAARS
jgi:hypothetical protein